MMAKLREIKEALRKRMHEPIPEVGKWLAQIVAGYFAYHAVPTNSTALHAFRYHVAVLWHRQLCPRSQRACIGVGADGETGGRISPKAPYPSSVASLGSVRGAVSNDRPYREQSPGGTH